MSDIFNKIEILYEDEYLLAVNKPAGLVIHSDGRTDEPTLVDWLILNYPEVENIGGFHTLDNGRYEKRAGILHRIDRETSGVILISRKDETFWPIQQQFLSHSIEKIYLAFCKNKPKDEKGIIDLDIGRSRIDYRQWTVPPNARGTLRKSITEFELIFFGEVDGNTYSLIQFKPKTGRTHQIRVHAKASGFPILCDSRYNTESALGFDRVALHAFKLIFKHPVSGAVVEIEAPLPEDFVLARKMFN